VRSSSVVRQVGLSWLSSTLAAGLSMLANGTMDLLLAAPAPFFFSLAVAAPCYSDMDRIGTPDIRRRRLRGSRGDADPLLHVRRRGRIDATGRMWPVRDGHAMPRPGVLRVAPSRVLLVLFF
jgi:hypothetical protein